MQRRKARIIQYEQPKAAAGGGGSRGNGNGNGLRPGQNLVCTVVSSEPGGYAVIVTGMPNVPGFLPTQAILRSGEEILAQFVCVHNEQILLSARLSQGVG
jgi:hypothetical protein